jgi:hypothetical protein
MNFIILAVASRAFTRQKGLFCNWEVRVRETYLNERPGLPPLTQTHFPIMVVGIKMVAANRERGWDRIVAAKKGR